MSRTYDMLAQHRDWTWSIERQSIGCEGCDWTQELDLTQSSRDVFWQHQADMIDSDEPKALGTLRHQHETWQIRRGADGKRYCAACGVDL